MLHSYRVLPFIRAFETVARLGHVRSAAAELNLTPSAISYQVKMLEQTLGQAVFSRENRRMQLTPQGERLYRDVASIMRTLETSLGDIVQQQDGQAETRLRIAAPSGLSHVWLAPKLTGIADQLGVNIAESHIAREMSQVNWRQVDLAIVYDNPPWSGCTWAPLPELRLSPLCTPGLVHTHPLRHFRDLRNHRLLHEDSGQEWQRWSAAARLETIPLRNAYFNRLSMAFNSALSGHGLALVSDFLAQKYLVSGQLIRPFDLSIPASKRYYVVALERRMADPFIARAFDLVLSLGRSEPLVSEA
ncbi:LysR family transcriptional regulator [Falsochrobactrum sp. TDYN1]|uniref:LysR family transcriptional regulator n=1 Tax=Falsochrobactrum tianjinense TaxID=2706015 RepID=A0A949UU95_9HYPH|nr:LysR substrate-binding domain-containing protein [Falsochrobactrum sp. TDYN1]MBV2143562.1 LysR family transcriptional regulator [Falsochrobactrum sp. TDYN1]